MSDDHEYPNQLDCPRISSRYPDWLFGNYTYIKEHDMDIKMMFTTCNFCHPEMQFVNCSYLKSSHVMMVAQNTEKENQADYLGFFVYLCFGTVHKFWRQPFLLKNT